MNEKSLLKLIDEHSKLKTRIRTADMTVHLGVLKLEIRAEVKRLYLLDMAAEIKMNANVKELKDEIVEGDGEQINEWMDVRDDIDDAELKLIGICTQTGAYYTQDKIRHICIKLQNIVFKHFGMGD